MRIEILRVGHNNGWPHSAFISHLMGYISFFFLSLRLIYQTALSAHKGGPVLRW